jgi:hypothetical protein
VPPPAVGASVPAPAVGGPAPSVRPATTPFGQPLPAPNPSGNAAAQPAPAAARPAPTPSAAPAGPAASPFAAAAPVAPNEKKVTLVIDDSAVKEDEIGRKSRSRNIVLVAIGTVLGLAVGFGVGSTGATRDQYNMAVNDGKDIYKKISEVSGVIDQAKGHVKEAVEASQGGAGKKAHVDYKAIESLVAMERPFGAAEFSRRRYLAFPTAVVDDLFEYYNNVNLLWDKFTVLGAKTMGKTKREALDKSAEAADSLMANQYGMVVFKQGDLFSGGMVLMKPKPPEEGAEPEEGAAPVMLVASKEGGREVERTLFMGQDDFGENYGQYVLPIDKGRSMGTLGISANLFGEVRGDLVEIQGIMTRTAEIQGRLIKELGKVAALEEQSFF